MFSRNKLLVAAMCALVMYVYDCVLVSACDSSTVPNCAITSGFSMCNTTDIPPIIQSLPVCITRLNIIQDNTYSVSVFRLGLTNRQGAHPTVVGQTYETIQDG